MSETLNGYTDFLAIKLQDHIFYADYASPRSTLFVALGKGTPTSDGNLTNFNEVVTVGTGYARVDSSAGWRAAVAEESVGINTKIITKNLSDLTYEESIITWGTVTCAAIFDDSSAGNMLLGGLLTVAKPIPGAVRPVFISDAFQISTQNQ